MLLCRQTERARKQKIWLFPILLAIPLFYFCINAGVPQRYKKLQMVNLIHQGKAEALGTIVDEYYAKSSVEYSGIDGHEDVMFRVPRETKIEGQYHTYGYLYSEDAHTNSYFGMYEVREMKHLSGNWYKVNLILHP